MSSSAMEVFTPSTNNDYDRSTLSEELGDIFNQLVAKCYSDLKNFSFIRPLKGDARRDYGDYVCLSVLEVCEELRRKDPDLFDKTKPKQIAEEILRGCQSDMNMINYESLKIRAAGIITFKLHGSWIAQRIHEMLINGIDTWAPIIYQRRARAVFLSLTKTMPLYRLRADCIKNAMPLYRFQADCIKNALSRMFLYSGIDVRINKNCSRVASDLKTIWYEVFLNKADLIVHVNPDLHRQDIQKCFTDARSKAWLREAQLLCCGYRTCSSDQVEKLGSLWHEYVGHPEFTSFSDLARDAGYQPEELFYCLLKYTWLKSHRLTELTFSIEEMLHREGNSFVYLLSTRTLIRSLTENSESPGIFFEEEALAGNGERELGLHLVEFTGVIKKACTALVPNIVCEYLFDLSKLFNSCYREVWSGKPKVGLCRATEVVMAKCFDLLEINPGFGHGVFRELLELSVKETRETVNRIIPSPFEARYLRSRFELFTMNVSVSDPDFDEGSIFGKLLVKDALGARADGWTRSDAKDCCYISCFNHEWHEPLGIAYDSLIPFGDPSCRRSVPVSSSVEVDLLLHAMSESKDQCYLIFHGKRNEPLSKFWEEESKTKCGTLKFKSDIGCVLVNFILLKEVVDASMEVTFSLCNPGVPVQICGSIMAYYGDDVVKDDLLGQYKATIFRTKKFEVTGEQGVLPLHRSLLAVPADGCLKIEALLMDVESKEKYVNVMRDYRARPGEADDLCIKCGNFSFNLKVTWSW